MTYKATMALEQVCEKEVAKEPVPVQEGREKKENLPHAPQCPADLSMAAFTDNPVSSAQAVADHFTWSVQTTTRELINRVEGSAIPRSPESSFPMTNHKIVAAKRNIAGKMLEASEKMETQRQWMVDEIRNLDGQRHGKVLNRIRQAEVEVGREELQIQHMIHNPNMELSTVMRAIAGLNEKKAYLKGLKFQIRETRD